MKWLDKTYGEVLPYDDPRLVRMRVFNAKGNINRFPDADPEYKHRKALGFYSNFNDIDHTASTSSSGSGWLARKRACKVSPYIVGLSCKSPNGDEFPLYSSGIIVESGDTKTKKMLKILTSTYITGGGGSEVSILLPNGIEVGGIVLYTDSHYNILVIGATVDYMSSAILSTDFLHLEATTMSLGRHFKFGLMACRGKIVEREDNLDADDLMSSSCIISESGIGGPVIDPKLRVVIGMNVHINKKSTSFIPSIILSQYMEIIDTNGQILCPWLGLKSRNLNEKKLSDLDSLYKKFSSFKGIFVSEVVKGSPADHAGICTNDIIKSCNGIVLRSPVKLSHVLFELGKSRLTHSTKRKSRVVELKIQRLATGTTFEKTIKFEGFTPGVLNKWPAVPLELSYDEYLPFSSKGDDPKVGEIWNPEKLQSKFTTRFQEEKSSLEEPGSLLSSIIGGENDKSDGLDGVLAAPVSPADIPMWLKTSNAGSSTGGPAQKASVLTCESLKQSMFLEVAGDNSKTHFFEKDVTFKKEGLHGAHVENSVAEHSLHDSGMNDCRQVLSRAMYGRGMDMGFRR